MAIESWQDTVFPVTLPFFNQALAILAEGSPDSSVVVRMGEGVGGVPEGHSDGPIEFRSTIIDEKGGRQLGREGMRVIMASVPKAMVKQ